MKGWRLTGQWGIWTLALMVAVSATGWAQQLVGTYGSTTPEASLFFLNPTYLNPAAAKGVLGLSANPAALAAVKGTEATIAFGQTHTTEGRFRVQILDSTETYDPVFLDSKIGLREYGGLAVVGVAHRIGRITFGMAFQQARRGSLELIAQDTTALSTHFDVAEPITRAHIQDLPVDSIPMHWNVRSKMVLDFDTTPGELAVSVRPIMAGVALRLGVLSIGAGLKYLQIRSSDQLTTVVARVRGAANVIGKPYGVDPRTGLPWTGEVRADVTLDDAPLHARYRFSISGSRWALATGLRLDLRVLKIGLTYERGLRSSVEGAYLFETIWTKGLPAGVDIPQVDLDLTQLPKLSGEAYLNLTKFAKDTVTYQDSGRFTLRGYHGISGGLQLLFLGAYLGGEIPTAAPDIASFYFGTYVNLPLLFLPLWMNAGLLHRSDLMQISEDSLIPIRSVTHLGVGISARLSLQRWIPALKEPVRLGFGLWTSILPLALSLVQDEMEDVEEVQLPRAHETLSFSFGLGVSF